MDSSVPRWFFVALPDSDQASDLARRLPLEGTRTVPHASGRPWLVVSLPDEQVVLGEAGGVRAAVLGYSSATPDGLRDAAGRPDVGQAFDALSHRLAGGFHLVASMRGHLRVQGSAAGVRRVFHARIDGVTVASDRADVLADLGGLSYDETAVAMRLLRPLPHPLGEEPLWRGLSHVPPESYLHVDPGGLRAGTHQWWRRPEPELSRREGAELLRDALAGAVASRTQEGGVVHCDVSGGMDSTPIAWFASRGPARVLGATAYSADPGGGEDLHWARRALAVMPEVEHRTQSLEELPGFFEGMPDLVDRLDEPTAALLAAPRMQANMRDALDHSARVYLNGLGGDQLLRGLPSWEHTLFRRRPLLAWRRARANRMLAGTSTLSTIRGLADRRDYADWLRAAAVPARRDGTRHHDVGFGWGLPFGWPEWLTPEARRAVRGRIEALSARAGALGPDRAAHSELMLVRDSARVVRGTAQLGADVGLAFEAPLLDDRVVEACLSVRREERVAPLEYKPLIKEAMRGLLPEDFLSRTTKTGGTAQGVRGIAAHHTEVLDLCASSPLVDLGIVDQDVLRERCTPRAGGRPHADLGATVNCAVFLANQARGRTAAAATGTARSGS